MNYWQIGSGAEGRDYSDIFIKYGIAAVGYGDNPNNVYGDASKGYGKNTHRLKNEIKTGDIVVLKRGTSTVAAVGDVISKRDDTKKWLNDFDGWALPAYCKVNWRKVNFTGGNIGLTRATIAPILSPSTLIPQINTWMASNPILKPDPEPKETNRISDNQILEHLIIEGLSVSNSEKLTQALNRIRLLSNFYISRNMPILEHETRTFLVIPLLLALGWAEQQIKIELSCLKGRIDIACFHGVYKKDSNDCALIIETKSLWSGLDFASAQAKTYANEFPNTDCVIVTNGFCYKVYTRDKSGSGDFHTNPISYMNLIDPRDAYPLDPVNVKGTLETISYFLPK